MRALASLLLLALAACGGSDEALPDSSTADAAGTPDTAQSAADAASDALPSACNPDLTRVFTSDDPLGEGAYCDDIFVCAATAAQAAAIEEAAPGFTCGGEQGGCAVIRCAHPGGTVSAADMEEICAITILPEPPDEVLCMIYL
jgi:hypothetical protein